MQLYRLAIPHNVNPVLGLYPLHYRSRFRDIQVNLSKKSTSFPDRESFAIFIKTVVMKPFLEYLPDSKKKDEFLDVFLTEFEHSGQPWLLDFVRLIIFARK